MWLLFRRMGIFLPLLPIAALRIGDLNVCSQFSKYQSVSIITISSRRDPTVSPTPLHNFLWKTSKAFRQYSFYNPVFPLPVRQKEQTPNRGCEYKNRPGSQLQSHGSNISVRSITRALIGLLRPHKFPPRRPCETEEETI